MLSAENGACRPLMWLLAALLAATSAAAAEPSLEVMLQPQRFGVDDAAQLTVRVNEPPAGLAAPDLGTLANLEVAGGPSSGSEFSFVNGVASRSQTFTYVLRGLEPGTASVGPVTVRVGESELRSEPVTAEVVAGSVAPPQRRGRRSPFSDPFGEVFPRRPPPRIEVELRHVVSSDRVVAGQPLVATVYLDSTTGSLFDFNLRTAPSYPGFWAQRLEAVDQEAPEVVEVGGTAFYRYQVMRSVLVPLKSGRLEIPAVDATIGVRAGGFFDSGQLVERSSPVRVVEVADRPPAPASFAGAVGKLRYSAALEPAEIEFGASTVVTVTLEGDGNLPLVSAPGAMPGCEGCDSYPPEESSAVTVDAGGIHGRRTWQSTVVPRQSGKLELAAVELAVFDPDAGRYVTQTIGPLALNVLPPPPTPTPVVTPVPVDRHHGTAADGVTATAKGGLGSWLWVIGALVLGVLLGGALTWFLLRRSRVSVPPRRAGQSPADRARVLQLTLERWWLDARSTPRGAKLEDEMSELRRDLEAVRFAPGRADHSNTVVDLEGRLKRLIRRA